jgi:hypothetical protein
MAERTSAAPAAALHMEKVGMRDFVLHEDGIEWNVSRILGEYLSKAGPLGVTECVCCVVTTMSLFHR